MYTIKDYYNRLRAHNPALPAWKALQFAKKDFAENTPLYKLPSPSTYNISYSPANSQVLRWVEHAASGLRFVNYCDEISCDNHRGWFTDSDFQQETLRGVVYLLPHGRYIAGYIESCNFDDTGGACLDFSTIYTEESDAARQADNLARVAAANEREYNDAFQAGNQYSDKQDYIQSTRKECLALITAIKKERARGAEPIICDTLRQKVKEYYHTISNLRKECADLVSANTWQAQAFNEGAGRKVIV